MPRTHDCLVRDVLTPRGSDRKVWRRKYVCTQCTSSFYQEPIKYNFISSKTKQKNLKSPIPLHLIEIGMENRRQGFP